MDNPEPLKILKETIDKLKITKENLREIRKTNQTFPRQTNTRILDAFQSFAQFDRAPIWMMRQAGRYLPEFKEIMKNRDFFDACQDPFIAAEITLQPLKQFEIDAAIIFSDILTLPKAMGMEIVMDKEKGPIIKNKLETVEDINRIKSPDPESLEHVYDALYLTRQALQGKQTLIGFCGAPFTVFSYMVEGETSKMFLKTKKWVYQYTQETRKVLDLIARESAQYLINQVKEGGAQVVQIFDSFAGQIPPIDYIEFVLPSLRILLEGFKQECPNTPLIMFAKDQNGVEVILAFLKMCLGETPLIDGFQLDSNVSDEVLIKIIESDRTIQGNLEPGVLYGTQQIIKKRVSQMIEKLQTTRRYIMNLSHGLTPDHEVEKVRQFIQESIRQSKLYKVREILE
ncbi:unnamed protein product [Paramecium octaurelia]|uniref:Uroporphyrinogen decarboxylase n=1 Tax=Paramecium octaurelia TaxID=43137 RepID=A0A8S1SYU7_PAROT|nr:unnamed protein product [Paramecium octaurelia]